MKSVRMQILGVFGGSVATPEEEFVAERVGATAARADWITMTGGPPGDLRVFSSSDDLIEVLEDTLF
jgi:hypothetical protein